MFRTLLRRLFRPRWNCCHGQAVCRADGLRVRAKPDTTAPILGALKAGETLDVWDQYGDWLLVQTHDGRVTGWSHGDYLEIVGELTP